MKRIVIALYWIGDTCYHKVDGERGLVLAVSFRTAACVPVYLVSFGHDKSEMWCDEIELSAEKVFTEESANKED